jgi:glycosyltransferase involved in cell wall biosynthesis
MSATRNAGVANAAGDYVAFLDADDVWLPVKLEQQVEILESHPDAAMVFGAAEYWHSWTGAPEDVERDAVPSLGVEADRLFRPPSLSLLLHPLGTGTAPCPSDICLRRDAFTRVGGFEESFRGDKQLYEDQAFLAKLYLRECVFISSKSWIRYRIHAGSCVSGVISSGQYEVVRGYFLDWLESRPRRKRAANPAKISSSSAHFDG